MHLENEYIDMMLNWKANAQSDSSWNFKSWFRQKKNWMVCKCVRKIEFIGVINLKCIWIRCMFSSLDFTTTKMWPLQYRAFCFYLHHASTFLALWTVLFSSVCTIPAVYINLNESNIISITFIIPRVFRQNSINIRSDHFYLNICLYV